MRNLVEYSSSEGEEEDQPVKLITKATKLPMLLQVDSSKTLEKTSSEDHQMRIRSIPHVEGNWATHVFIECKFNLYLLILKLIYFAIILGPLNERLQEALQLLINEFNDIHLVDSTHVSLSKTFILRYIWLDPFFSSLREQFKSSSSLMFQLQFSSDVVYLSNEEKTRYFACILVSEWCQQALSSFIEKVDKCLKDFNLPVYYEEPSFHLSVLWKLKEFSPREKSKISSTFAKLKGNNEDLMKRMVDRINCKSGNKLIEILL